MTAGYLKPGLACSFCKERKGEICRVAGVLVSACKECREREANVAEVLKRAGRYKQ